MNREKWRMALLAQVVAVNLGEGLGDPIEVVDSYMTNGDAICGPGHWDLDLTNDRVARRFGFMREWFEAGQPKPTHHLDAREEQETSEREYRKHLMDKALAADFLRGYLEGATRARPAAVRDFAKAALEDLERCCPVMKKEIP